MNLYLRILIPVTLTNGLVVQRRYWNSEIDYNTYNTTNNIQFTSLHVYPSPNPGTTWSLHALMHPLSVQTEKEKCDVQAPPSNLKLRVDASLRSVSSTIRHGNRTTVSIRSLWCDIIHWSGERFTGYRLDIELSRIANLPSRVVSL